MLRAGTQGPNPLILAGLTEENVSRLKAGMPIKAPLSSFSPGTDGTLAIIYGKTHAELEQLIRSAGMVGAGTYQSVDSKIDQHEAASRDHQRILICTVGLPYSGKTTWAKSQSYPIVNPDSIRIALHGQRFYADAEPFVWATAKVMVRSLFHAGHSKVILDATNMTKKRRAEWFDERWATFFKIIDTSAAVCRERAINDAEIQPVIDRMAAEFEPLDTTCNLW